MIFYKTKIDFAIQLSICIGSTVATFTWAILSLCMEMKNKNTDPENNIGPNAIEMNQPISTT